MELKTLTVRITGIRPLLMKNGLLADPQNETTRAIKEITNKGSKKMTVDDHRNKDRLQWEGSLYWDDKDGAIIPSDNIERCIQLGAQKARKGKDIKAAVLCAEPHSKLEYDGPRSREKLCDDPKFCLRKMVVQGMGRVPSVRPMFPTGWKLTFTLEYDPAIVDRETILRALQDAGALVGLGDWRPKFGRFTVEVL